MSDADAAAQFHFARLNGGDDRGSAGANVICGTACFLLPLLSTKRFARHYSFRRRGAAYALVAWDPRHDVLGRRTLGR
jgi:hypothetical protein